MRQPDGLQSSLHILVVRLEISILTNLILIYPQARGSPLPRVFCVLHGVGLIDEDRLRHILCVIHMQMPEFRS
jgi:hypothetical protein